MASNTIDSAADSFPLQIAEIKILQITDLHLLSDPNGSLLGLNTEATFLQVLELARSNYWPPDYILLTGDLAQDPTAETYSRLKANIDRLNIPSICLPGNHDDPDIMKNVLKGDYVHFMARCVIHEWQIIPLNSQIRGEAGGNIADDEIEKLCGCLNEYPEKHALIAVHHHPIPCESQWMDTMLIRNWKELLAILDDYKQANILLCGHIHQEMDERDSDKRILGCPSTCFQFKPTTKKFEIDLKPPGYRWLELFSDGTVRTGIHRLPDIPAGLDPFASTY